MDKVSSANTREIYYRTIDLKVHAKLCLDFRRDAFQVSFGSLDGFSEMGTLEWYEKISGDTDYHFLHVLYESNIIGQLEFRTNIKTTDGDLGGYINLIYLLPDYRKMGIGQLAHDFIIAKMRESEVQIARLKYSPLNERAGNLYKNNGWKAVGEIMKNVQLMEKSIQTTAIHEHTE